MSTSKQRGPLLCVEFSAVSWSVLTLLKSQIGRGPDLAFVD